MTKSKKEDSLLEYVAVLQTGVHTLYGVYKKRHKVPRFPIGFVDYSDAFKTKYFYSESAVVLRPEELRELAEFCSKEG